MKTQSFYLTDYRGAHYIKAWHEDITACKRYAKRVAQSIDIEGIGIYDATECEQVEDVIFPKANAVPIWIFRDGQWRKNTEYIY